MLMMMAAVLGVMAASIASMSSMKSLARAGTSTVIAPALLAQVLYSGKYGVMAMTSSPGRTTALMAMQMGGRGTGREVEVAGRVVRAIAGG